MEYAFCFLLGALLYGFIGLFRSICCRARCTDRIVRLTHTTRKYGLYVYAAAISAVAFVHGIYRYFVWVNTGLLSRAESTLLRTVTAGLCFVYLLIVILRSKYIYITDSTVIFPDCVRKATDYRYRLTGGVVELLPVKPPQRTETYTADGDTALLEEILSANYQKMSEI